jgi:hypothetical protein
LKSITALLLPEQRSHFDANLIGAVHPRHANIVVLHHVARAVIPTTQEGARLLQSDAEVGRDLAREIHKPTGAGLDMVNGEFGTKRQRLRVYAGVEVLELLGQLLANFRRSIARHQLIVGTIGRLVRRRGIGFGLRRVGLCGRSRRFRLRTG